MIRRSFAPLARAGDEAEEDMDPRLGLVNLADVMLVFACGLMLALVAHWGVDISGGPIKIDDSNIKGVNDITPSDIIESSGEKEYEEIGRVFRDIATGEMYVLKD